MTSVYERDIPILKRRRARLSKQMNLLGQGFQQLENYTQTYTQTDVTETSTTPHRRVIMMHYMHENIPLSKLRVGLLI